MEIIEETIRYIDALHHQLAARISSAEETSAGERNAEAPGELLSIHAIGFHLADGLNRGFGASETAFFFRQLSFETKLFPPRRKKGREVGGKIRFSEEGTASNLKRIEERICLERTQYLLGVKQGAETTLL